MKDDPIVAMAACFGPTLKDAFPNEPSVTRFAVATALAEIAVTTLSQPQHGGLVEALNSELSRIKGLVEQEPTDIRVAVEMYLEGFIQHFVASNSPVVGEE